MQRWRSMINRRPHTSKRRKIWTVWTGRRRHCCTHVSRQSWILTIQTCGSSAACSNGNAQTSREPSRRKRAQSKLVNRWAHWANASNANAASERQPKRMPIWPGSDHWPHRSRRMNRRIGETEKRRLHPFAHSPIRPFALFFACLLALAMAGANFAQDEEEEEEVSNAKPDAGGIVIDPSSGKISEGITITITFPVSMV